MCTASKHYISYDLNIHVSLPYLSDFVCVCVCVCARTQVQACKCFSTECCVTYKCTKNKNIHNIKAFTPVSVSKLTVV